MGDEAGDRAREECGEENDDEEGEGGERDLVRAKARPEERERPSAL